jgi:Aspartyl protease
MSVNVACPGQGSRNLWRGLILGMVFVLTATGCQRHEEQSHLAPLPKGELAVRLLVLHGPGGTAMALVPVYINGQGPFTFALDTGASHTLIDREIADRLNLEAVGEPVETTGVSAEAEALPVRVQKWRVGDIKLPPRTLITLRMAEPSRRFKLQGLLGSDILSQFGVVQIDYKGQVLTLRPK